MEHSYFFNSVDGDRIYQASDFAKYFDAMINDGVITNSLQVSADGSEMKTKLLDGSAFIEGYRYENDAPLFLDHEVADPTYNRIDLVVLQLDKSQGSRYIKAIVKQGTPSSSPVAPSLTDDGYIKEMVIAEVLILAGKSFIEQTEISDKRTWINSNIFTSIVEYGSNTNGYYLRFNDGTQICYKEPGADINITNILTQTEGTITTYRGSTTWVFPAQFLDPPYVSFTAEVVSGAKLLRLTSPRRFENYNTSVGCQMVALETFDKYQSPSFYAIGRWK